MTMPRSRSLAATLGGPLLLIACSGGPSNEPTGASGLADPTPPPVATATPQASATEPASPTAAPTFSVQTYPVPAGSGPHDVAPAADGGVWYTAQASGELGWLNPDNGQVREIALGPGSAPHGVIVGPDGAAWITDGGLNAIVRVDAAERAR